MKQNSIAEEMLVEALAAEALGEKIKMRTFVPKSSKCYAIQYTGDNREKIIDALKIQKEYCESWINEDTKETYLVICAPGCNLGKIICDDWILIGVTSGSYAIMGPIDFKYGYEEIK